MNEQRRGFLATLGAWLGGLILAGTAEGNPRSLASLQRQDISEPMPRVPDGCEAIQVVSGAEFDEASVSLVISYRWLILPKGCIGPEH